MSEKSKSTTHAGVLGDMARLPGKLTTHTSSGDAWHVNHAHVPMQLCRTRSPLDEGGSLSLGCSRFHVDTPNFQYPRRLSKNSICILRIGGMARVFRP